VEQIKNTLSGINSYVSFLGIIIKNNLMAEARPLEDKKPATSQASIINLNNTEQATEKLLAPSGIINPKDSFDISEYLDKLAMLPQKLGLVKGEQQRNLFLIKDKIFFSRRSYWRKLGRLGLFLKDAGLSIGNAAVFIFHVVSDKEKLSRFTQGTSLLVRNIIFGSAAWLKNLKLIHKAAFLVIILCITALSFNISWSKRQNRIKEAEARYAEISQQIETKQNQVDSSILYQDNDRASDLFAEIGTLIEQLPHENEEQNETATRFQEKYQEQLNKVSKASPISDLVVLANLGAEVQAANLSLASDNQKLYAVDATQTTIFVTSLDGKVEKLTAPAKIDTSISPALDRNNNLYYRSEGGLLRLDADKNTFSPLGLPSGRQVVALSSFNYRLYALDQSTGQIYKYERPVQNLNGESTWLKAPDTFTKPSSIDIDGKIYVLDGKDIRVYANGQRESFVLATAIPEVNTPSKMIVSEDGSYIYLLESSQKRLLVFDKNGDLVVQYTHESLAEAKDYQVNETAKKIYVLTSSNIHSFNTNHLK
jgi:hypothetical protein